MCFSCAATKNKYWPHYSVHSGDAYTNHKINKYERNNSYNDNGIGEDGIERRDQFKCGRPLSHSLGAPSTLTMDAINLSDSVPNLCAGDNATTSYCNGHSHIKCNTKLIANKSYDAFDGPQVYGSVSINSVSAAGDNGRSKLLCTKPPISEKSSRIFFGVSLDEREMPITRERQTKLLPAVAKRDLNGRKANKSNGAGLMQSARIGNTKSDLFMDRPRNR